MDEENEREVKEKEWRERQEERKKADEEKLGKNQAKRARARARKEKAKMGGGVEAMSLDANQEDGKDGVGVKKKLGAARVALQGNGVRDSDDKVEEGVMNGNGEAGDDGGGITFHDED